MKWPRARAQVSVVPAGTSSTAPTLDTTGGTTGNTFPELADFIDLGPLDIVDVELLRDTLWLSTSGDHRRRDRLAQFLDYRIRLHERRSGDGTADAKSTPTEQESAGEAHASTVPADPRTHVFFPGLGLNPNDDVCACGRRRDDPIHQWRARTGNTA